MKTYFKMGLIPVLLTCLVLDSKFNAGNVISFIQQYESVFFLGGLFVLWIGLVGGRAKKFTGGLAKMVVLAMLLYHIWTSAKIREYILRGLNTDIETVAIIAICTLLLVGLIWFVEIQSKRKS